MTATQMIHQEDHEDPSQKLLCFDCVGDTYLREEIQQNGRPARCSFCERVEPTYTIGDLAERVDQAFEQHYERTPDQPNSWQERLLADRESNYDWERDGEPVVWAIANAASIEEEVAQDIQSILEEKYGDFDSAAMGEETEFCSDSHYEERPASDERWQAAWADFGNSLKTETRFFSQSASDHLSSLFGAIETMSTIDKRPMVIDAGPGTSLDNLYRARVFQSNKALVAALGRPDLHLGPPPSRLASPGRMNAGGISVFYGANHPQVAISEVRPPIGSQVAVAEFSIVRPIRLLDLTALSGARDHGSVFDPDFAARTERTAFLRSLSERISQPIMPDDEAFEYLPTQAVADFLATGRSPQFDGIIFPSSQAGRDGLNVVLFHKASRVERIQIPEGAKIEVETGRMYDDGWERDYTVTERIPSKPNSSGSAGDNGYRRYPQLSSHESEYSPTDVHRESTLRLNVDSIRVHIVNRVNYDTSAYPVTRYQWEDKNFLF